MENAAATEYLSSLLGKTLIIRITDQRVFVGILKCTDKVSDLNDDVTLRRFSLQMDVDMDRKDRNIVLDHSQEFREQHKAPAPSNSSEAQPERSQSGMKFTSRYVGLVVVPGEHIEDIELEEFDPSLIV